jgi:hypothetical protein
MILARGSGVSFQLSVDGSKSAAVVQGRPTDVLVATSLYLQEQPWAHGIRTSDLMV